MHSEKSPWERLPRAGCVFPRPPGSAPSLARPKKTEYALTENGPQGQTNMQRDLNPIDQDVLDCLDNALLAQSRPSRVDPNTLPGNLKALVAQFRRRASITVRRINDMVPPTRRCPTHIFFCEALRYGAFAMRANHNFIVLNVGLVPTLTDFFQRMMATVGLWPDVGKQAIYHANEPSYAADAFPAHMLWKVLPRCAPDDPLRMALATVFMGECFDVIVRHEFAHLVLGHLAADAQLIVKSDTIARQALELAADGHAAIWGLLSLQRMPAILEGRTSIVSNAYHEFHRTPDDALINYLLLLFFVFRLMDEIDWNNHTLGRGHPPAPMRFHTACIRLVEHVKQQGDADGESRMLQAMQEIWELGEIIFAATLGRHPNPSIKCLTLSEMSERHYNQMSDRAQTLPQHLFGLTP
jgi:hypothetical protein